MTRTDELTYGGYLRLDALLGAQAPRSDRHDEMLFIILHQTMELWMKQVLYEVDTAQAAIETGAIVPAYKHLARVSRIQAVMTSAWDILATMTPADYLGFRDVLGSSSGFQSAQFRRLEFRLGLKDARHLAHHDPASDDAKALRAAIDRPSLYHATLSALAREGLLSPAALPAVTASAAPLPAAEDAWRQIYQHTAQYWPLYQLAEKLLDLDDALLSWRHKHVTTVERVIGGKRGTGGTDGVRYLRGTLERRCFPDLWSVRTVL